MSLSKPVQQSAAAPYDTRTNKNSSSQNTRTDEAASRRAEKRATIEQSQAKAHQIEKEVLEIETVTDKAQELSSRIDVYV